MTNGRIPSLDIAKGIGIILVVLFHSWRGIVAADIGLDTPGWRFADHAVYIFHMPLFFFVAGLFAVPSAAKTPLSYLRDKTVTVYYPYLLWSAISLTAAILLEERLNHDLAITTSRFLLVPVLPKFHYWFLFTLMLYYVVAAWVRDARKLLPLALLMLPLAELPTLNESIGRYLHFYLFFVAGMAFSRRAASLPLRGWQWSGLFCLACAILSYWLDWRDTQSLVLVPAALAGVHCVLGAARAFPQGHAGEALAILGSHSLAIYLTHILAASGTRILLTAAFPGTAAPVHLVAGFVAGIALPMAAYAIIKRFGWLTLTGLGRDRRSLQPATLSASSAQRRSGEERNLVSAESE